MNEQYIPPPEIAQHCREVPLFVQRAAYETFKSAYLDPDFVMKAMDPNGEIQRSIKKLNEPLEPSNIAKDWLVRHDFKIFTGTDTIPHYQLRLPDSDYGLGIEVCEKGIQTDGTWHCWIVQDDPRRHIHVRHMTTTDEIELLYEGLTGQPMPAACICIRNETGVGFFDAACVWHGKYLSAKNSE